MTSPSEDTEPKFGDKKYGISLTTYGEGALPMIRPGGKIPVTIDEATFEQYLGESRKSCDESLAIGFQKRTYPRFMERLGVKVDWDYINGMSDEECVRRHKAMSEAMMEWDDD